jgi:hypothetical protein
MVAVSGRCPNCSAPISFSWSGSVQAVCTFCRSVIVRHDVDLAKVGEVATVPEDSSPIQIGTTGRLDDRPFTVTGRILYQYARGGWNEWHLALDDGSSAWLSDAMAEYAVSRLHTGHAPLPASSELRGGMAFRFSDGSYRVTTITRAKYRTVEGELPFEYWDKDEVLFADLRSVDGRFATIDYSEQPALLFVGRFVEFDALGLGNVRRFEGWAI